MPELFVELLSEEIPARMQVKAAEDFQRLVTDGLVDAGLPYEGAFATATPRRLVLSVSGLPARSPDRTEERRGPRVGSPEKAVAGFLRAAGLSSVDEAEVETDPKKGEVYVARTRVPGLAAIDVAGEVLAASIRRFPWPVTMRWGEASSEPGSLRWVRPLSRIIATFGAENEDPEIVPVDVGVPVGQTTVGHRVHAPDEILVRRLDDYRAKLERAFVVVDHARRREQILHDARDAAFARGLTLVEDERLLTEMAGLVEWPVVLVGTFDEASLALPEEVIRLTIRENQKCFVTRDGSGALGHAFVLVANQEAPDGGAAIVVGNERVVRARLADARFFYEEDVRVPLAEHAARLASVTFHERLGSQADRVERIAALAREIAPACGADPDLAEEAARLAKADLVTGMVGEFPELQGYMGRRYAEAQGLAPEVAAAIEEHYAPQGPSDAVPTAPVSVAVALADKVDQLVALWAAGEKPTGSGDPYGLRRSALGIIRLLLEGDIRIELTKESGPGLLSKALDQLPNPRSDLVGELRDFLIDRIAVQWRERGVSADVVRATVPPRGRLDVVDFFRRVGAVSEFLSSDAGASLLTGHRRATSILGLQGGSLPEGEPHRDLMAEPEEKALARAIDDARSTVDAAVLHEDYAGAMQALATLRYPVDSFFDNVMVNSDDPKLRANRLRLLRQLWRVALEVADFGEIQR